MKKNIIRFSLIIVMILITLLLSSCIGEFSIVREHYRYPDIRQYRINNVGIMPMVMDDTTDNGTFYSTNYLLKSLKQNHTNYKFSIVDVDNAVKHDPDYVKNVVQLIRRDQRLSNSTMRATGLDSVLNRDSIDAILIGNINKVNYGKYFITRDHHLVQCKMVKCDFTYYLVSIYDGQILWRYRTIGTALNNNKPDYPPLDVAISNGIDEFINSIPL
jgi:hypothetical protein